MVDCEVGQDENVRGLDHVPDVEESGGVADVMMACNCTAESYDLVSMQIIR